MNSRKMQNDYVIETDRSIQNAMPTYPPIAQQKPESLSRVQLYSTLLGLFMLLQLSSRNSKAGAKTELQQDDKCGGHQPGPSVVFANNSGVFMDTVEKKYHGILLQ
ncbi:hypothetical protein TURU_127112 [Turdus rufiventris]|nr:hypothetical protein TURU_127112 [Turdus rufiventris]